MSKKNKLFFAPPFIVEDTIKQLGVKLRTARLRRNLTIQHVAETIGTGTRAVMDAEKGKLTSGIGIYAALLWAYNLLDQLQVVADPNKDAEGQTLSLLGVRERDRVNDDELDNDF